MSLAGTVLMISVCRTSFTGDCFTESGTLPLEASCFGFNGSASTSSLFFSFSSFSFSSFFAFTRSFIFSRTTSSVSSSRTASVGTGAVFDVPDVVDSTEENEDESRAALGSLWPAVPPSTGVDACAAFSFGPAAKLVLVTLVAPVTRSDDAEADMVCVAVGAPDIA